MVRFWVKISVWRKIFLRKFKIQSQTEEVFLYYERNHVKLDFREINEGSNLPNHIDAVNLFKQFFFKVSSAFAVFWVHSKLN